MKRYLMTVGDALSQLGNAVFFNSGNANESISGRAYRQRNDSRVWRWAYLAINWVFWVVAGQSDHCRDAHEADRTRALELLTETCDL